MSDDLHVVAMQLGAGLLTPRAAVSLSTGLLIDEDFQRIAEAASSRRPASGRTFSAERYDPTLYHRRADTFYDPFLRLWRNLYEGPEPSHMDTTGFLDWVFSASEEELNAFAEGQPLPVPAQVPRAADHVVVGPAEPGRNPAADACHIAGNDR